MKRRTRDREKAARERGKDELLLTDEQRSILLNSVAYLKKQCHYIILMYWIKFL
jgi:hypothetical protein